MSGYDCRNKWVFSSRRNVASDGADWTSSGRLFQSRGADNGKWAIADSDTSWRADFKKTGSRQVQATSVSRRQVGDVLYNMVRMCCSANARSCLTIKCLTKLQSKWGNVKKVFVTLDCNLVKVTTLDNCYCVWHSTKRNYQNGSRKLDSIIILTSQYIILQNVVKYNGWKLSPYGTDGRLFASDVCANYKVTWHKN